MAVLDSPRVRKILLNVVAGAYLLPEGPRSRVLSLVGIQIGPRSRVGPRCVFAGDERLSIGADCFVGHGCTFDVAASIVVGDGTYLAPRVDLVTSTHEIGTSAARAGAWLKRPIMIGAGCWLGTRVTVLPGVTIGDGCVVAAGAVVTKDCKPNGVYAGVPARRSRDL